MGGHEGLTNRVSFGAVWHMEYETFADAADAPLGGIDEVENARRLHAALGYQSPVQCEDRRGPSGSKQQA